MKDIWSKAPEGATHWDASPGRTGSFMKVGEDGVYFWPPTSDTPRWCHWSGEPDEHFIPRPMAWNGEGYPPDGIDCEYLDDETQQWLPGEILARRNGAWIIYGNNYEVDIFTLESIRPRRTPEQIAAEEREKARDEALNAMSASGSLKHETEEQWQQRLKVVGEMLDMGYRKQVQP